MAEQHTRAAHRDIWVALGLLVSALSAAVSSYAGLHALALATGWQPWVAPLFPLTVDCYAMTAVRVWLARSTRSMRARRFARANAIGAILLSVLGNAAWHLIAAGLVEMGWVAVVLVGAVPPVVAVLRTQDGTGDGPGRRNETTGREAVPPNAAVPTGTVPRTERTVPGTGSFAPTGRRYATEDELLAAAREADATHRTAYRRPITRDQLRRDLRVGGDRATAVLRQLREEGA